jgi:hypothetical protein
MTSAQAILAGAALIAASIIFVSNIHSAEAQKLTAGPFQLMHHSNTVANAGVFKIDESTGEVTYCYITADSQLTCTRPVK